VNIRDLILTRWDESGGDIDRFRVWLVEYLRYGSGVREALMGSGSLDREIEGYVDSYIGLLVGGGR